MLDVGMVVLRTWISTKKHKIYDRASNSCCSMSNDDSTSVYTLHTAHAQNGEYKWEITVIKLDSAVHTACSHLSLSHSSSLALFPFQFLSIQLL